MRGRGPHPADKAGRALVGRFVVVVGIGKSAICSVRLAVRLFAAKTRPRCSRVRVRPGSRLREALRGIVTSIIVWGSRASSSALLDPYPTFQRLNPARSLRAHPSLNASERGCEANSWPAGGSFRTEYLSPAIPHWSSLTIRNMGDIEAGDATASSSSFTPIDRSPPDRIPTNRPSATRTRSRPVHPPLLSLRSMTRNASPPGARSTRHCTATLASPSEVPWARRPQRDRPRGQRRSGARQREWFSSSNFVR